MLPNYHNITQVELTIKTIISGILIFFAQWLQSLQNVHLPTLFMEITQWFSYLAAGCVSLITIYKFFRGTKSKSNE